MTLEYLMKWEASSGIFLHKISTGDMLPYRTGAYGTLIVPILESNYSIDPQEGEREDSGNSWGIRNSETNLGNCIEGSEILHSFKF